ncbi:MAG: dienelactone hydrolase [Verrucomicrobiales bacterium]|jgi:dienelactone hydrolase
MKVSVIVLLLTWTAVIVGRGQTSPFPGTELLTWEGDLASLLVDSADAFLLKEIEKSGERRAALWQRDWTSAEAYANSIEKNRKEFQRIIGAVEKRSSFEQLTEQRFLGTSADCDVYAITWPAFGDVHGEGLLIEPRRAAVRGNVVLIPDADQVPEALLGWVGDLAPERQLGRLLAERGARVVIPTIINRTATQGKLSNREYLYRPAFELGRHLIGYEVLKVQAILDWLSQEPQRRPYLGVAGWGEGGLLAFYTAAVDTRVQGAFVSGYFGPRESVWEEPAYRNVFGLLSRFGDAEIASLIAPRRLVIEAISGPQVVVPPGTGGKPGRLATASLEKIRQERQRAIALIGLPEASEEIVMGNLDALVKPIPAPFTVPDIPLPDAEARHARQMHELDRHNQQLLVESPYTRAAYMKDLKTDSLTNFEKSTEAYREYFAKEVIGEFDDPLVDAKPRSRVFLDTEKVTIYEVVLDVYDGFFAYGLLCWPKNITEGEKRPVVVCQHGLEGRPQMVIGEEGHHYYKAFAMDLAERGFITFAPQHLYIFEDRFRTLQFKANAVKKTLFSLMVPQHEQLTRWLGGLKNVDSKRIGFYGLSYGGKSAMRIPPLVPNYCLSICSADFNDWVWKNASTRSPYSYAKMGEYEIFEFDLGSTFNYAEMAALIAPRPFMVERGHFDGVAPDERVALEFAKVRHLYAARLKIPDRVAIEWFDGPHSINSKDTFDFLHRHLKWPYPGKTARKP